MKYKSLESFENALRDNSRQIAEKSGMEVQDVRKRIVFDSFLGKLFSEKDSPWVLKGGYALNQRLSNARETHDIDIAYDLSGKKESRLGSEFTPVMELYVGKPDDGPFTFEATPKKELKAPLRGGMRYHVLAKIADVPHCEFTVDVAGKESYVNGPEKLQARDYVSWMGVRPPTYAVVPREFHFTEKTMAYLTVYPGRVNSRAKDLIDMVLLIHEGKIDEPILLRQMRETYGSRARNPLDMPFPKPPAEWKERFLEMARATHISPNLDDAHGLVSSFLKRLKSLELKLMPYVKRLERGRGLVRGG